MTISEFESPEENEHCIKVIDHKMATQGPVVVNFNKVLLFNAKILQFQKKMIPRAILNSS